MNELLTHIVINPEIRFEKPCIKGTRITVGDILQWHSRGMTEQEIIANYPELQKIHIGAAFAFAAERDTVTIADFKTALKINANDTETRDNLRRVLG